MQQNILAGFVVMLAWVGFLVLVDPLQVSWSQLVETPSDRVELFYAFRHQSYKPDQRLERNSGANIWLTYDAKLFEWRRIRSIRVDPSQHSSQTILIGPVEISSRWGGLSLAGPELLQESWGVNHLEVNRVEDQQLEFRVTGDDPHFSLTIPRSIAYPTLGQVLGHGLLAFIFGILFWYVAHWGMRWVQIKSSGQPAAMGASNADLPARFGRYLTIAPTGLLVVMASMALVFLVASWLKIAQVTPHFQGPDEGAHIANVFHGFNTIGMGGMTVCSEVWVPLNALQEHNNFMVRRFTQQLLPMHLESLRELQLESSWSQRGDKFVPALHASCENYNLITGLGYNVLTIPLFKWDPHLDVMDWLKYVRQGQIVVASVLISLLFWIVVKGRYILGTIVPANEGVLRFALLLAVVLYLAIPQNLFLFSVINREAYLVPLGVAIFISFFFRSQFVTPLLIVIAVYAFWPMRAPYLFLIILLLLWYGGLWLYERRRNPVWLFVPAILVVGVYAIAPYLLMELLGFRDSLPFSFPGVLAIQEYFWHFHRQVIKFVLNVWTLSILDWRTFFGFLGSLDTPVPKWAVQVYKLVFVALATTMLIGMVACRRRFFVGLGHLASKPEVWGTLSLFVIALPLTVGAITYSGYQVYMHHGIGAWGSEVQGRYFLPVYFYIFGFYFILGLLPWMFRSGHGVFSIVPLPSCKCFSVLGFIISLMVLCVGTVGVISRFSAIDALHERYFLNDAVFHGYMEITR